MDKKNIRKEDLELLQSMMGNKKKEPLQYKVGQKWNENEKIGKDVDTSKLLSFIEKTLTKDLVKKFKKLGIETSKTYEESIEQMELLLETMDELFSISKKGAPQLASAVASLGKAQNQLIQSVEQSSNSFKNMPKSIGSSIDMITNSVGKLGKNLNNMKKNAIESFDTAVSNSMNALVRGTKNLAMAIPGVRMFIDISKSIGGIFQKIGTTVQVFSGMFLKFGSSLSNGIKSIGKLFGFGGKKDGIEKPGLTNATPKSLSEQFVLRKTEVGMSIAWLWKQMEDQGRKKEKGFLASLLDNPFMLAIAAIAGAIWGFALGAIKYIRTMGMILKGMGIVDLFLWPFKIIKNIFISTVEILKGTEWGQKIIGFFKNIGIIFMDKFDDVVRVIKNFKLADKFPFVGKIMKIVKGLFGPVFKIFEGLGSGIFKLIGGIGKIFSGGAGLFGKVFKTFARFGGTVFKVIAWPITVIMGLMDFFTGFSDEKAAELIGKSKENLTMFDKITSGVCSAISGLLIGLISPEEIYNGFKRVYDFIAGFFGIFGNVLDFFTGKISFTEMIEKMGNNIKKMWDAFSSAISFIFNKVGSWLETIAGWLGFGPEWNSFITSIKSAWDSTVGAITGLFDWIVNAFNWITNWFTGEMNNLKAEEQITKTTLQAKQGKDGTYNLRDAEEGKAFGIGDQRFIKRNNEIFRMEAYEVNLGKGDKEIRWTEQSTGLKVDELGNLINEQGVKQLDVSKATEENMADLLYHATEKNSIYTHDTHMEELLNIMIKNQQEDLQLQYESQKWTEQNLPSLLGAPNINVAVGGPNSSQISTVPTGNVNVGDGSALGAVIANEGWYGSVNKNDNGKGASIGKLQWNSGRARDILLRVREADRAKFDQMLPQVAASLANEQLWASGKRSFTTAEAQAFNSYMKDNTKAQAIMDAKAREDFAGYIQTGQRRGITDEKALAFYADLANQYGHGKEGGTKGAIQFINKARRMPGGLTLENLYEATRGTEYFKRRTKMYEVLKNLPAGSMMPTMETNAVPKAESLDLTKIAEGLETSSGVVLNPMDATVQKIIGEQGINTNSIREILTSIPLSQTPPQGDMEQLISSQFEQEKKSKEELAQAVSSGVKQSMPKKETTEVPTTKNTTPSTSAVNMPAPTDMNLIPIYVLDYYFGLNISSGGIKSVI